MLEVLALWPGSRACAVVMAAVLLALDFAWLLAPVFAQPAPEFEIVSVVTRSEDGTVKSTFHRGEFVFVEVKIRRKDGYYYYYYAEQSFLVLVSARMGSPPVQYGIGGFRGSLGQGEEITAAPGFQIPSYAPTGTMTIKVMVWTNWAAYGGYPVATPVTVTITVV